MRAEIKICMDSAAFSPPGGESELAGILREVADKAEMGVSDLILRDANGNPVGHFRIIGQPRRFAR